MYRLLLTNVKACYCEEAEYQVWVTDTELLIGHMANFEYHIIARIDAPVCRILPLYALI